MVLAQVYRNVWSQIDGATLITAQDLADANRVFGALSEGGNVMQPLIETFFSPGFGMVTDKFGTPWMIVAESPEQQG